MPLQACLRLNQWFPTRGPRTPWKYETSFQGLQEASVLMTGKFLHLLLSCEFFVFFLQWIIDKIVRFIKTYSMCHDIK